MTGDIIKYTKKKRRLNKKLDKAFSKKDQSRFIIVFQKAIAFFIKERELKDLSDMITEFGSLIEEISISKEEIDSDLLRQAIELLDNSNFIDAALILSNFGFDREAILLMAKRGLANELANKMSHFKLLDKIFISSIVDNWERYNGDISNSVTVSNVLKNISQYSPEIIPDKPKIKEIIGNFKEAAILYIKNNELVSAARCYEQCKLYREACQIYEDIGNKEGVYRTAVLMKDYEKALKFYVKPAQKARLLIELERFAEARSFIAGLKSPDEYFKQMRKKARRRMEEVLRSNDYITALDLAEYADCEDDEKEDILKQGRKIFDQQIKSAESREEIEEIYRKIIKFEEKAGNFGKAARIAEDALNDMKLASLLYEKANLFNLAIDSASEYYGNNLDKDNAKLRFAELHEKGGNLIKAAKLYESARYYDRAYTLYNKLTNYKKALECYLKTENPDSDVLIKLYYKTGEYEKAIDQLIESGNYSDLEKALLIAKQHNLPSHIRVLENRLSKHYNGDEKDLDKFFTQAKDEVMISYCKIFGMDFGTTNSVAAIYNKKNKEVEIIPASSGSPYEPSFFGIDDHKRLITGEKARLRFLENAGSVVDRVKRNLGHGGSYSLRGRHFKTEEAAASILNNLKINTENYLRRKVEDRFLELLDQNDLRFPKEILEKFENNQKRYCSLNEVVLSVPAYYNDNQKRATRDAAEIAGIDVIRLLHEPTAAALAYGYRKPYKGNLAVIDLGGGTLDISLLNVDEKIYQVLTVGGHIETGGSDIDTELVRHVCKDIRKTLNIDINEREHQIEIARLRDACERLKIDLSSTTESTMFLDHFLNTPRYEFTMSRYDLEKISTKILNQIKDVITEFLSHRMSSIDNYLLVGNAVKMPAVKDIAASIIKVPELHGINPGTVVVEGNALEAAVLAEDIKESILIDVVPYSLGIAVLKKEDSFEIEKFSRIVQKDTTIPVIKSDSYTTTRDNQTEVRIRVFQGEAYDLHKNYFLGEFLLTKIVPAPAGIPKIQVSFDIGPDCILRVYAKDVVTGNQNSIIIRDAITLSPIEKKKLAKFFAEREHVMSKEQDLEKSRIEISDLRLSIEKMFEDIEVIIKDFLELFDEKIESNPSLYKTTRDQAEVIQKMYSYKDQFIYSLTKYRDQYNSVVGNLKQTDEKHLDLSDDKITSLIKDRQDELERFKKELNKIYQVLEKDVRFTFSDWNAILRSIEPNTDKMSTINIASYYLSMGKTDKATEMLEKLCSSEVGLTKESFSLLLKCYLKESKREEYRDLHKKYGKLFDFTYPELYRLNTYLKKINRSIFMIQGISEKHGPFIGSGFSVSNNQIITNRHVVEGSSPETMIAVGREKKVRIQKVELDPFYDLAILSVEDNLEPLRLGEFDFIEPGEDVIAIGFTSPNSTEFNDNIFISRGTVNSIRQTDFSPERVIFIDTQIRRGMSGGPLINDLGEVVGLITMIQYAIAESERGAFATEYQPIALPIHLVRKYLVKQSCRLQSKT